MQSFEKTLSYFKDKEDVSLHKFVLQKMSSQVARQKLGNGNTRKKPAPQRCISRSLYETPVSAPLIYLVERSASHLLILHSRKTSFQWFKCSSTFITCH